MKEVPKQCLAFNDMLSNFSLYSTNIKCRDQCKADPRTDVTIGRPIVAICVQEFDARGVVQFTLINTVSCALHRHTSRVIHHPKLYFYKMSLPTIS